MTTRDAAASEPPSGSAGTQRGRLARVLCEDFQALHPRLRLAHLLLALCPRLCLSRLRTRVYRACGIRIGPRSLIHGTMSLMGSGRIWDRLCIGADCQITTPICLELGERITIGDRVVIGHHATIMTTTHEIGGPGQRCGPRVYAPVAIEDGCWIGAHATVLPGVTIGSGSVVAAGAVVVRDVPPHSLAGGVPARVLRSLDEGDR